MMRLRKCHYVIFARCRIPFDGSLDEPHRKDEEGFIDTITVGESRKGSDARITSIHFLFYATLPYLLVDP